MRRFNNREEEFLKLLEEISDQDLDFFSYFLQNKYFTKKSKSALFVIPQKEDALLFIEKSSFDNVKTRKEELKRFFEVLSLLEYLKQNRLINLIPNPHAEEIAMHIMHESFNSASQVNPNANIVLNNEGAHMKFPDLSKIYNSQNEIIYEAVRLEKHTYLLIMNNLMGLLFVSEELKNFVRHKFRSTEDIRYKKSQIATWAGITLAFIFGLYGMLKPAKLPLDRSLRLDQSQFDTLIYQNEYLNQEIKSILDLYRSDTLIAPKKIKR